VTNTKKLLLQKFETAGGENSAEQQATTGPSKSPRDQSTNRPNIATTPKTPGTPPRQFGARPVVPPKPGTIKSNNNRTVPPQIQRPAPLAPNSTTTESTDSGLSSPTGDTVGPVTPPSNATDTTSPAQVVLDHPAVEVREMIKTSRQTSDDGELVNLFQEKVNVAQPDPSPPTASPLGPEQKEPVATENSPQKPEKVDAEPGLAVDPSPDASVGLEKQPASTEGVKEPTEEKKPEADVKSTDSVGGEVAELGMSYGRFDPEATFKFDTPEEVLQAPPKAVEKPVAPEKPKKPKTKAKPSVSVPSDDEATEKAVKPTKNGKKGTKVSEGHDSVEILVTPKKHGSKVSGWIPEVRIDRPLLGFFIFRILIFPTARVQAYCCVE